MSETALKLTIMLHSTPDNEILLTSCHIDISYSYSFIATHHYRQRTCSATTRRGRRIVSTRVIVRNSSNLVVADSVSKTKEANGGEGMRRARKRRCIGTKEEGKGAVELSGSSSAQFAWPATLFPGGFFLHLRQVFDNVFIILILTVKSQVSF